MFSLAFKTLIADRGKLLAGLGGVIFSLVLVNVQGGLYLGLMNKASVLIDHCDADLWVGHRMVENVDLAQNIPESWIHRIRGLRGIERVEPYIVGKGTATLSNGGFEDVWIIGSEPMSSLGTAWNFRHGSARDLRRPDAVSFDEVDAPKLKHPAIGDHLEVNGQRARLAAGTSGISGFVTMPYLFTTLKTARQLAHVPPGECSFFLVKARPGADVNRLFAAIRGKVPDAAVYTPQQFAEISQRYWADRTGIGISFGAATVLGLFVGLLMVAQSLYALALDHLEDYATLKALGAEDRHILGVIVLQALTIAVGGALAGLLIVAAIRRFWWSALAPIDIPPALAGISVSFLLVICLAAAVLPYLRIRRVDPATVLQG